MLVNSHYHLFFLFFMIILSSKFVLIKISTPFRLNEKELKIQSPPSLVYDIIWLIYICEMCISKQYILQFLDFSSLNTSLHFPSSLYDNYMSQCAG